MIQIFLLAVGAYAAVGVLFAVPFLVGGIGVVDPAVARSPRSVRLLFLPGVAALWPLLMTKWIRGSRVRSQAP